MDQRNHIMALLYAVEILPTRTARAETFARTLALGAEWLCWPRELGIYASNTDPKHRVWIDPSIDPPPFLYAEPDETGMIYTDLTGYAPISPLATLVQEKWQNALPDVRLLIEKGYVVPYVDQPGYTILLTDAAFDLVDTTQATSIQLIYRNEESAALALLLSAAMKAVGLHPRLDVMTVAEEAQWSASESPDAVTGFPASHTAPYVVCLIGPTTLQAEAVQQALRQAHERGKTLMAVYHHGYTPADSTQLAALFAKHRIFVVEEESTDAYHRVLVRLLNRFGITP